MAELKTWIERAATLFQPPPSDDEPPNDRLPSEQVIGHYALRGYRGPEVLVASKRYFAGTVKLELFVKNHAAEMARVGWRVPKDTVLRDVLALEELAEQCDAVQVVPAY